MPTPSKIDRRAILEAAVVRLREGGVATLSLRLLAKDLGVAPNALYYYFSDRAHLESALANECARQLHSVLESAVRGKRGEMALTCLVRAYLHFARTQPNLYEMLLFPANWSEPAEEGHVALWRFVTHVVSTLEGKTDVPKVAISIWALVHGAVLLEQANVFGRTKPRAGVEFGLLAILKAAARSKT